jgi:alkylation response protein AidB-like acyl-CoA dehydrogenase
MPMIDLETELSDEERTIQETIHRFAAEVMRPAGIKLDALADPADVIAKDSILWDVFEKHRALGLDEATDPAKAAEQGLTPVQQARLRCIIAEEQGWGDFAESRAHRALRWPRCAWLLGDHRAGPWQRHALLRHEAGSRATG